MATIYIEITNICNAKCQHCPLRDILYGDKLMDITTFTNILEKFKKHFNKISVVIGGGEPSLISNLFEYVQIAKKYASIVTVVTNGSNIDNVIRSKPDIIEISFNSFTRSVEDKIYGIPIFIRKLSALLKVLEYPNIFLLVRYTLTKDNFDDAVVLRMFLDRLDPNIPMFVVPIKGVPEKRPIPEQLRALNELDNVFIENYCPAGKTFFAIDVDGNIMSCFITRHKIGTINNIEDAIKNGKNVKEFECEDNDDYIKLLKSLRKKI